MHTVYLRLFTEEERDLEWKAVKTRYGVKVMSDLFGELTLFFRDQDNPVRELPRHLAPQNIAYFVKNVLPAHIHEAGIDVVVVNDEHEYDWGTLVALESKIESGEIKIPHRRRQIQGDTAYGTVN